MNTPTTIPPAFAGNETLTDAYKRGWNHGHGIACHNVPKLGDRLFSDSLGRVTVHAENIREVHENSCWDAQENARQYSPFEFTAHEFNSLDDDSEKDADAVSSEAAWEAFEEGVTDSIHADLATYTDDDYGITEEEESEEE